MTTRVPVTVLTGFLGAGKTTLVNRILSEQHGKRIAVIENEYGEVGVDHEIVIGAEEEIFETANGCICCTVRGDLIRILRQLSKRRDRFDAVLIETTGLADPGPVAQTFFIDEELREQFELDAIVTVVDARHIEQTLAHSPIAAEQIAFADVILLNKTDLVDSAQLERVERQVRALGAATRIVRTRNAEVPLDNILGLGAFDLQRAMRLDRDFLETARPFEWAGLYALTPGRYVLHLGAGESGHEHHTHHAHGHDEPGAAAGASVLAQVDVVLLPAPGTEASALEALLPRATELFAADPVIATPGQALEPEVRYRMTLATQPAFELRATVAGAWALFTEHGPAEFGLHVHDAVPLHERSFGSHHHDLAIGSVGLTESRPLDANKVNDWLSYLLQSRGQDLLRMKGILSFRGENRRYVFHGVHMVFDGALERPWPAQSERLSRLVFIGRNLDRDELEAGLASCIA